MNNQTLSKVEDLEKLIELAEKVSSNIDIINDKVEKRMQYAAILFFAIIFFCLPIFKFQEIQGTDFRNKYDYFISVFFSIGLLVFVGISLRLLFSVTNMRKTIKSEILILQDLLNMIHSYKEIVYKDISIVKKAVIDMRLSRIKFNKKDSPSISFSKKEKVVPASP